MKPIQKSAKLANVLYDVRGPIVDAAKQMEDEGQKIISVSYRSLEVYLAIALVYLILTSAAGLILRRAEQRLRMGGMVQ